VNTKDQENLLRQHMPEGFVEEYVTRDNAKVSDQFMPAANLFVVPGQRLFSMLYPGPKSGHTWGHIRALPEKKESEGIPLRARIGFKNRAGREASTEWASRIRRICVHG
jgi:hypothetical protein